MQIGHERSWWPEALLKELIDNALDAYESAGIAPGDQREDGARVVRGLPTTAPGSRRKQSSAHSNFMKRISDKVHYVSPTRGQLGNALKTVYAAPFVADGERGLVEIWSQGKHHRVEVTLDRLAGRPVIKHTEEVEDTGIVVKNGTIVRVPLARISKLTRRRGKPAIFTMGRWTQA